ncbi:MAG: hypothetical protein U0Y68_18400 [Blastocatellia bacterium]
MENKGRDYQDAEINPLPEMHNVQRHSESKMKKKKYQVKYFSVHQDLALELCQSQRSTCPFNCAKDGAANCEYHVRRSECEPGRQALSAANELERKIVAEV